MTGVYSLQHRADLATQNTRRQWPNPHHYRVSSCIHRRSLVNLCHLPHLQVHHSISTLIFISKSDPSFQRYHSHLPATLIPFLSLPLIPPITAPTSYSLPLPLPSAQPSPTPRNPVRTPSPAPYPAAPALRALWTPIPSSRADPSRLAVGDPPAFAAAVQTLPRRVWPSRAPRAAAWFLESLPLLLLRWGVQRSGGGGARGR